MSVASRSADQSSELFKEFEPFVSDSPTLVGVLEAAHRLARVEQDSTLPTGESRAGSIASQVVIGKTALMFGFLAAGVEMRGQHSSASWLVSWLEQQGVDSERILAEAEKNSAIAAGLGRGGGIIASISVRSRILPRARQLAISTVGRDRADARHLLFALLQEPPGSYSALASVLTAERLPQLRAYLVDRILSGHETDENVEAWRLLAGTNATAEAVGTWSDAPALVDGLGRQAFAEVLSSRIKQVSGSLRSQRPGNDSAFILHLDGPWGSGKSSILNFLRADLQNSQPGWFIVEFNAWRNQFRKPAWWPLIAAVGGAVSRQSWWHYPRARWVWMSWSLRMRWVPILVSLGLILAFLYFAGGALGGSAEGAGTAGGSAESIAEAMGTVANSVLALVALAGLAWTASRSFFFGSRTAAEAYVQSSAEPFRPIILLFERLIAAIHRPVAIFIDDIDRCDSAYVIELLEGIQTLMRSAPVVYVVAGDRKWICSSFEKRYTDFCGELALPGRPLGYLFLDKVFQLSTAIPRLSAARQSRYWKQLLETDSAPLEERRIRDLEAKAEQELRGKTNHEDIQREIDRSEEGSIEQDTLRAAAAKQITSPAAMKQAEHRLQSLAPHLEPNPRSMKRLVNAYGLNHARAFLEGRSVGVEALARWTIVELRWPILADYLASNWTDIAAGTLTPHQFDDSIKTLLADADVRDVFGREGDKGRLTKEALAPILE